MAQYTSDITISSNWDIDQATQDHGGVTYTEPHIFDIADGVTVTFSGSITSSVNKLIKRGAGTFRLDTDQGSSMAGGYQLEEGTIDPNGRWLSTYGLVMIPGSWCSYI